MTTDAKGSFVAELARDHGARLRRYLARKLRDAEQDLPDLMQEIFLRLLRVERVETIRSPEAYLFTVAFHVMHQHKLALASAPESVDVLDGSGESEAPSQDDPANALDARRLLASMELALSQLPRNVYVTLVLSRGYGYSLEEIARELGVSRSMCKKYLALAIAHCRNELERKDFRS